MKDTLNMENNIKQNMYAEGRICIDLTDPLTGKVKERVEGKNMTFPVNIYGSVFNTLDSGGWVKDTSQIFTVLTDNVDVLDPAIPLVPGQVVGYGIPGTGSSGTGRGAYNAANQVLAAKTLQSIRWKYQYDFTTAQANGTIGTIGLSHQYTNYQNRYDARCFTVPNTGTSTVTNDGRYSYYCSTAGIITKSDGLIGVSSTIDVSATVGTANTNKTVVYDALNGRYGIYVYSSTAALIRLYMWTDNTFTTLYSSYSPSNVLFAGVYPMYIYENYIFCVTPTTIAYANYISNTAYVTINPTISNLARNEGTTPNGSLTYGTLAKNKYLFFGFVVGPSGNTAGILDMSNFSQKYYAVPRLQSSFPLLLNPFYPDLYAPCGAIGSGYMVNIGAAAMKKLDVPITKTTANGMTVTYELEVFW